MARIFGFLWRDTAVTAKPSTGAKAQLIFGMLDAALKRRSSTVVRGFVDLPRLSSHPAGS